MMKITKNTGLPDRLLRIMGALCLVYIGFFNQTFIGNAIINLLLGGFGLFNIPVALIGFCPVYHLARVNTYRGRDTARTP